MEIHISTDDRNFATNVCNDVQDRLTGLKGYACFSGYNIQNQYEYKVFKGIDDLTEKFPKRITFGEMINLMRQSKGLTLYFQREDWRNTHNFIALNDSDGRNIYLEKYYEDNRYNQDEQYFDEHGIPIRDAIPYIPTYDDMFIHSWILCDFSERDNYEEKTSINSSTV